MPDLEKVFAALPHVNEIWITSNGHFHLHPNNGGEIVTRKEAVTSKEEEITSVKRGKTKEKKTDDKSEE